jgi:hypothetical protein
MPCVGYLPQKWGAALNVETQVGFLHFISFQLQRCVRIVVLAFSRCVGYIDRHLLVGSKFESGLSLRLSWYFLHLLWFATVSGSVLTKFIVVEADTSPPQGVYFWTEQGLGNTRIETDVTAQGIDTILFP